MARWLLPLRFRYPAALALLVATVACSRLLFLELWLLNNDNYITLGAYYSSVGHEGYQRSARRYYEASVAACNPGDARCVAYAGALHGDKTYARPIIAYFGSRLATRDALSSARDLLQGIARATVLHVVVAALAVIALLLAFLHALPRGVASFIAWATSIFGVVAFWLPEQTTAGGFQPLLGVSAWGALGVFALAGLAAFAARGVVNDGRLLGRAVPPAESLIAVCWTAAIVLLPVRILAYAWGPPYFAMTIPGAEVGLLVVLLSLVGCGVFVVAIGAVLRSEHVPAAAGWVALVLLFGFVSVGENFFSTAFHIAPRGAVFVLAAPVLIYAALRPNGAALWLLPALAVFHVSIAGLLYGCIIATEVVAGVRRRRLSLALMLAVFCLAGAALHTAWASGNPVIPPATASFASVLARVDATGFLPALAVFGILSVAARIAWRLPDLRGDLLLRAVVLGGVLAAAGQLRYALQAAGIDIMDPVAYNYILLSYYVGPAICAAGIFLVAFALAARTDAPAAAFAPSPRALALIAGAIVALAAARAGNSVGRPAALPALVSGLHLLATQDTPVVEPAVRDAAAPSDQYVVGRYAGDTITMMSVLKMRLRSTAGLLDPKRVEIVPAAPR